MRAVGLLCALLACGRPAAATRMYTGLGGSRGPCVRLVSVARAARVLEGWVLEMKYAMDSEESEAFPDGVTDVDVRRTDDSVSGPFQLSRESKSDDAVVAEQLARINDVIVWIQSKRPRHQKSVYAVLDDSDLFVKEQALAFVETHGKEVVVNGYTTSPLLADGDGDLRALLALELLNLATTSSSTVTFLPLS